MDVKNRKQAARKTMLSLLMGSVLMFGFGFALVPLYDVFCRITGLNGKVELQPVQPQGMVDRGRRIQLQFMAVNNESMPWEFKPSEVRVELSPGELYQTGYRVKNLTGKKMVAQAVPSVSPAAAAPYVQKVNCFCFERQPLNAAEEKLMPLLITLDPDLPGHIRQVTLSYTLFDITDKPSDQLALNNGRGL